MTAQNPHAAPPAQPWRWALLGALLGLAAMLACCAPAAWLAAAVDEGSAGRIQLSDVRGTLWTGSARLTLTGGVGSRDSAALPGRVDWTLRPRWRSLHPGLDVKVAAGCCTVEPLKGRLSWSWRQTVLHVDEGASQWPAALLAGLGTPWNTLQPEGELQLTTHGLALAWPRGGMVVRGRAELIAAAVSSRLAAPRPLGSYRLGVLGGDAVSLELATLEGRLQLSGRGDWTGPRLHFEGTASAAPEDEAALANLLNIIGRRNGARSLITLN
jgi:general secretion pathway protein N